MTIVPHEDPGSPRRCRRMLAGTAAVLATLAIAGPARAALQVTIDALTATSTYDVGGGPAVTTIGPNTTGADIFPFANAGPNSVFAHVYALPSGTNGSRSSGTNSYTMHSVSDFQETVTNTSASPDSFTFNFLIDNGQIGANIDTGATGWQAGTLSAVITLDGVPAFQYTAGAEACNVASGGPFSAFACPGGTYFTHSSGLLGDTLTQSGLVVSDSWGPYLGTLNVPIGANASVVIDYQLVSDVAGAMTSVGTCGLGGGGSGGQPTDTAGGSGGGNGFCNSGAIARIGDPFGVPEPASLALLVGGLAGLGLLRRHPLR